jgi:predicted anti-sigma-YlaC factor YlaD
MPDDLGAMDCNEAREHLSARLDGEEPLSSPPGTIDGVDHHLMSCASCRAWGEAIGSVRSMVSALPAVLPRDRTAEILGAAERRGLLADAGALDARHLWRVALAMLAVVQLVLAIPGVLMGSGHEMSVHMAREHGSWDVALAVGLLFAAWRPARAWGLLPLVGAFVGSTLVASVVDVAGGQATALYASSHSLEVASLLVLWLLARPQPVAATPRMRLA